MNAANPSKRLEVTRKGPKRADSTMMGTKEDAGGRERERAKNNTRGSKERWPGLKVPESIRGGEGGGVSSGRAPRDVFWVERVTLGMLSLLSTYQQVLWIFWTEIWPQMTRIMYICTKRPQQRPFCRGRATKEPLRSPCRRLNATDHARPVARDTMTPPPPPRHSHVTPPLCRPQGRRQPAVPRGIRTGNHIMVNRYSPPQQHGCETLMATSRASPAGSWVLGAGCWSLATGAHWTDLVQTFLLCCQRVCAHPRLFSRSQVQIN